jgi:hypothetical protein
MKKIKLNLSSNQQRILSDMLQFVVLRDEVRAMYPTEYYVLMEWYRRQASRFLFINAKPFLLLPSQACALWRLMSAQLWMKPFDQVATAILWQLDRRFAGEKLRIKN